MLKAEQWVAAPIERVFRFFADPRNLPLISPPSAGVRLKSGRLVPPALPGIAGNDRMAGVGSEIAISLRFLPHFPVRATWTAQIIEFEWLQHFRDLQISGPFEQFDHTHSFQEEFRDSRQGTIIHDYVRYEVGLGPLGVIANGLFVHYLLRQMFNYRHMAAARELEDEQGA